MLVENGSESSLNGDEAAAVPPQQPRPLTNGNDMMEDVNLSDSDDEAGTTGANPQKQQAASIPAMSQSADTGDVALKTNGHSDEVKVDQNVDSTTTGENENVEPPSSTGSLPQINVESSETASTPKSEPPTVEPTNGYSQSTESLSAGTDDNDKDDSVSTIPTPGTSNNLRPGLSSAGFKRRNRRSPSIALSIASTSSGQHSIPVIMLVKKAFDIIKASKDARKMPALEKAITTAISQFEKDELPAPKVIFDPLRIVYTKSSSNELKCTALDCIAKLLSFPYFEDTEELEVDPSTGLSIAPNVPLLHQVITSVCEAYNGEATDAKVEIQILKALSAAVLNDELVVHQETLLAAVRQTYNIFVHSTSSESQATAQATLTQMVNMVFDRAKSFMNKRSKDSSKNRSATEIENIYLPTVPPASPSPESGAESLTPQLTLKQMKMPISEEAELSVEQAEQQGFEENEINDYLVDAFLVFRTMCKLSEKPVDSDSSLKSLVVRSKLLALTLVHTMMKSHISVFSSPHAILRLKKGPQKFITSCKDYICLTLAKNAASILAPVFEISAEIFWIVLSNLRSQFKREIPVFLSEIYFPIAEMRTSTSHQKLYFLSIISKISNDPRALVEIYLNYDCDRASMVNIYEHLIELLSKMASVNVSLTPTQQDAYLEWKDRPLAMYNMSSPFGLSAQHLNQVAHLAAQEASSNLFPPEYALKVNALESLVAVLRSMLTWSQRDIAAVITKLTDNDSSVSLPSSTMQDSNGTSRDKDRDQESASGVTSPSETSSVNYNNINLDDPDQFENLKHRKAALTAAIREFNYNTKHGLARLLRENFIKSDSPEDIASFLLTADGLNKASVGEYLGGGDEYRQQVMHAFVDQLDFRGLGFVSAIRKFLQTFRLPGEAQQIDRILLKFANRFTDLNPEVFSNAEVGYILAYSVMLLNTDQHNKDIKKRMTVQEFIRNNRGINNHSDLPEKFLTDLYNDIHDNEITLASEQHAALISGTGAAANSGGLGSFGLTLATVGRDLQREAYMKASREMVNKTEQLFKNLLSSSDKSEEMFYIASHIEHVRPMFEVAWMSFMGGFSAPFQSTDDVAIIELCIEGLRLSIRIACLFDVELARVAFVSVLAKFSNLQSLSEMRMKNVQAGKTLLSVALSEGNSLRDSWKDVLRCISQLERLQLIAAGVEAGAIPDVTYVRISRESHDRPRTSSRNHNLSHGKVSMLPEVSSAIREREVVVGLDKVFTQSSQLSGESIISFVEALTQVSWEEIESSGNSEHPRMFSLQKMVDVAYYNMDRIRVEWSKLWLILGESFNRMVCHDNIHVVSFALDSLRQLSLRFFDIQELAHFKFQKDFLKPFECAMLNNKDDACRDLVLQCMHQMLQSKSAQIRSGWTAMFAVFSAAATVNNEVIVTSAFQLVKKVHDEDLDKVITQGCFNDWMKCLTDLGKIRHYQKVGLQAIKLLQGLIPQIPEIAEKAGVKDVYNELWFPILAACHEMIMNGDDLEVRSRALNYLFDTLTEHGESFSSEFWDRLCKELLFPIFVVLKSRSGKSKDELSVWLSTTMIQALRNMISLLTTYYDMLSPMLEGFLDLLVTCVDQDNDTVSRIGSSCLLQLVLQNVTEIKSNHWKLIVDKIVYLFDRTTAYELLDGSLLESGEPRVSNDKAPTTTNPKFREAVIKSILQLLMIDTIDELLKYDDVYSHMPTNDIVRICSHLQNSYQISQKFNVDRQLRTDLWHQGFMAHMPNLLKQESASAHAYLKIMFRLYKDEKKSQGARDEIEKQLIDQCIENLRGYNALEAHEQRYHNTLSPVIVRILEQFLGLNDADFKRNLMQMYSPVVGVLRKEMLQDLRENVHQFLERAGPFFQVK